ncbi:fimbrial protein, partial [Escherichia coli]
MYDIKKSLLVDGVAIIISIKLLADEGHSIVK